jgi:hypothetical protein
MPLEGVRMYLVAIVGRDRRHLLEKCLASLEQARRRAKAETLTLFALDPLCVEYDRAWLEGWEGLDVLEHSPDLHPTPRVRVAAMRCAVASFACASTESLGISWIVNIDADVAVDPDFFDRLDDVIASGAAFNPCGAVAMGNYAGYRESGYLVEACPGGVSDVRTHGLGGCLAFPLTGKLADVAARGVPKGSSWDSYMCRAVAGNRVLTSQVSYARHLGRDADAGMCAALHSKLDWDHFSPALEVLP